MSYDARSCKQRAKFLCPAVWLVGFLGAGLSAQAATLCVKSHGQNGNGCYSTISAAVAAASAGDTINVSAGTYAEEVWINKPLSLVGENRENTIISATGLSNGIYIDGLDSPGLSDVVVKGFTVEGAKYEGILAQNVSGATIAWNIVQDNDENLLPAGEKTSCPGLPAFETNEGDDCGEGIHLMGADHSTVADNIVQRNAGGILISDETAMNDDNVITRNTVQDNPYDCGITLASHGAYLPTGGHRLPFGIYHNTISENESLRNGIGGFGGAGVGLFAPGPGNVTTFNSVVNNRLIGNGLPGVAIHNHVYLTFPGHPPNPNVNNNSIVGNYISGNAADPDLPTPGTTGISIGAKTPITGLVIAENVIEDEMVDVAMNSASVLQLHMNNLSGKQIGVLNMSPDGVVDATENWWGCSGGPLAHGCSTISGPGSVLFTPWLTRPNQD